jgi:hypothetical protein
MKHLNGNFCWRHGALLLAVFLATEVPLLPQIIGPYPGGGYPGRGYPPYGYPGGGVGLPMPRIPGRGGQQKPDPNAATTNYEGKIKKLDEKNIALELDDGRTLTMKRTGKTKFYKNSEEIKSSALRIGDHVSVDATEDQQGFLYALKVTFEEAPAADERSRAPSDAAQSSSSSEDGRPKLKRAGPAGGDQAAPQQTDAANTGPSSGSPSAPPAKNSGPPSGSPGTGQQDGRQADSSGSSTHSPQYGNDGPPQLKRGKPESAQPPAQPPPPQMTAASQPTVPVSAGPSDGGRFGNSRAEDPVIAKAREATFAFSTKLPNFICQEFMARFARDSNVRGWQPLDVVSAEIIYDSGQESYRNLKINDRPTEKKMEDLSGSWSTGEFATTLNDLFHPITRARFRFGEETKIGGLPARIYDFDVAKENSHWIVQMGSQQIAPAYRGSVWIDKESNRVLRIEIQARDLPGGFPMDTVESAVDYAFVRIAGEPVLLPSHAESLGCQRGTNSCSRNVIDFRNYRKYTADSKIIFDQ